MDKDTKILLGNIAKAELFIWPFAPWVHGIVWGAMIANSNMKKEERRQFEKRKAEIELRKITKEKIDAMMSDENLTDEDIVNLFKGIVKTPADGYQPISFLNKAELYVRKESFIDNNYQNEHLGYRNGLSGFFANEYKYALCPYMKWVSEKYREINHHELWDNPCILKWNTLNELDKVDGFNGNFNWMLNGYIRISETDWGFVGIDEVQKVLEKANNIRLENMAVVKLWNSKEIGDDWKYPRNLWRSTSNYTNKRNRLIVSKETYEKNEFDAVELKLTNSIMNGWDDKLCFYDPDELFLNQEPIYNLNLVGYVRISKDKWVYIGRKEAWKVYRDINNKSILNHLYFLDGGNIYLADAKGYDFQEYQLKFKKWREREDTDLIPYIKCNNDEDIIMIPVGMNKKFPIMVFNRVHNELNINKYDNWYGF